MTTLAEHIIVAGAENRPPMLQKSIYDSWVSRIRLFIKGEKNGRMMLDSIDNSPLVYPTVEDNGQTRPKKYSELTEAQQLQDDCDVQETNIILHGLSPDVYALSETLYEYYWRFSQLINDMHTIEMIMQQVQLNTKFLNALPLKLSKFVTDVKLAKSLYTTNYDQLYAYLSQHERHANEARSSMYPPPQQFTPVYAAPSHHQHHHTPVNPQQQSVSPQPFISPLVTLQSQAEFPQLDSGLAVPTFQFPPSNNQLRMSSNPINQATIQDGRVTVQQVQGRQTQSFAGTRNRGIATTSRGNYAGGQVKVVKCYNYMGEGHMAKQCTQPKKPRSSAWFKEKLMLAKHKKLDVQEMQYYEQTHINGYPDNEINSDINIIPYSQSLQESQDAGIQDTTSSAPNDLLVLSLVEQMIDHVANLDKENQSNKMVNESLTAELERYKERVAIFEQRLNVDLNKREKLIDSQMDELIRNRNAKLAAFQQEIDTLKETLSNHVKEKESLSKTLTVFKTENKEKESKYIDKEIVLEKQNKELENIISQQIKPTLYDGSVIVKEHVVISVIDDEETLILEEESRSKMLDKQNDPISIEKKINHSPIDYLKLNKIKEDFGKHFVTQKELSAEQAFWLKHSNYNPDTSVKSPTPVRIEAPSELPMVNLVNESLKKLKHQLASFDKVVKKRTTSDAITA
ncbi:hypothetical protein Tco_0200100, partial [Tanacetum coccineum]